MSPGVEPSGPSSPNGTHSASSSSDIARPRKASDVRLKPFYPDLPPGPALDPDGLNQASGDWVGRDPPVLDDASDVLLLLGGVSFPFSSSSSLTWALVDQQALEASPIPDETAPSH